MKEKEKITEIEEKFSQLPKKLQKGLIQKYKAMENTSTDGDSYHEEESYSKIKEVENNIDNKFLDNENTEFKKNIFEEKNIPKLKIKREALQGDKWGNSKLSEAIENGNMTKVRDICNAPKELSDNDLLRELALEMMKNDICSGFGSYVRESVYSEAKHQLELMGEDVSDIIDAYDIQI